uniref:Uncharacterized protein n=1 Tax=Globodera rostochiensis TaxID=31243 RepID=A0A914GU74_GLORO
MIAIFLQRKSEFSVTKQHAQKVGRFCEHLLMGEGLQREVISERLHHGIDQIKDRVVQIRQLMDTIFMDWEVWPILYNFELFVGPPDLLDNLIEQLGQKIDKMRNQLGRSGSYYNKQAFDDAMKQLMVLAINETDRPIKKFGQIWTIVPKLMVKSMSEMLDNLLMDLIDPSSRFYGVKILFEFAKEINIAETVCADILRRSTLTLVESILIIDQLKRLKNNANELFKEQKSSMIDQIRNVGQKLKNKMEVFKLEKGTLKRQKLIETLQKDIVKNGLPTDDVELSDQILSCLNIDEICKLIEQEGDNVINRILF